MKIIPVLFLLVTCTQNTRAQISTDANQKEMIAAELAFVRMARLQNTRDAFMFFLADDGVTFGEEVRVGKKYLEDQPPDDSRLSWKPVYSDIAASGDFGFNTGPWEFRQHRTDRKPIAFGQFVTVWTKQSNGNWKAALDIGISHPEQDTSKSLKISEIRLIKRNPDGNSDSDALQIENHFIHSLEGDINKHFEFVSDEARFFRTGNLPYRDAQSIKDLLIRTGVKTVFVPLDGRLSASRDMAYVYGKVLQTQIQHGSKKSLQSHYLRIWKKENHRWKIVIDVISRN